MANACPVEEWSFILLAHSCWHGGAAIISFSPLARAAEPPPLTPLQQLGRLLLSMEACPTPRDNPVRHVTTSRWGGQVRSRPSTRTMAGSRRGSRPLRQAPSALDWLRLAHDRRPACFCRRPGHLCWWFLYDGRADTLAAQIPGPLQNPNEMTTRRLAVVKAVIDGPNAGLFQQVFKVKPSSLTVNQAFADIVAAIIAFESTSTFSPFSSKYDAYVAGKATLTSAEMAGLQLFTGSKTGRPGGPRVKNATCASCHTVQPTAAAGRDLFTSSVFRNTGIPRTPLIRFTR